MSDEDLWKAELSAKLDHIHTIVDRLEKRVEKDATELYERVRKLEIDTALQRQAWETSVAASRRTFALVAGAVGTGGGAVAAALTKLLSG